MKIPHPIKELSESLAKLPGIGPRQAIRIAYFLANRGRPIVLSLLKNLSNFSSLKICPQCFYPHDNINNLCNICSDVTRDQKIIAIVEKETDVASIESAGIFNGRYFILGEIKKNGFLDNDQKIKIETLKKHLVNNYGGKSDEMLIGFDHTSYGDVGSEIIIKELGSYTHKLTRLGRGMPTGGEVEFADASTLAEAIKTRR